MRRETTGSAMPMPPQIIDDAASWFVTMRDPFVAQDQREAFAGWLRASPAHVQAYLDVARMWGDAAQVSTLLDAEADLRQPSNIVPLNLPERRETQPPRASRRLMLAASVLFVCIVGGAAGLWQMNRPPVYGTTVGEQRIIMLEDGSAVRLNSRSRLRVSMTATLRNIDLLEGQALFEVARDPSRPFVVHSSDASVRAIGTSFDVNRRSSGTVVTVVEGKVTIEPARVHVGETLQRTRGPSDVPQPYALTAGQQATVGRGGRVETRKDANVAAATSWLHQELVFEDQSLDTVIEEFNRYARTPIVLRDASLKNMRVNAVFHTTNPDSFLRYVSRVEGVQIERDDGEIRITRRVQVAAPTGN